jgi:hypothetical protein
VGGPGVLAVVLVTLGVVIAAWRRRPAERYRALGLFLLIASELPLALAVGWARAPLEGGHSHWYVIFLAPALCGIYLAWTLYGPPAVRVFAQTCLFTALALMLPLNVQYGLATGAQHRSDMDAFRHDLRAGVPPLILAERYDRPLMDGEFPADVVAMLMRQLHQAKLGPFGALHDPPLALESLAPLAPAETHHATWEDGLLTAAGDNAYLVFRLPAPRRVAAVQLRYAFADTPDPARCRLAWRPSDRGDFDPARSFAWTQATEPGEQVRTVWVNDTVHEIRLQPDDRPCVMNLAGVALVTEAAAKSDVEARVEVVEPGYVVGWAWVPARPAEPPRLDVYVDRLLLGSVAADQPREDLVHLGAGGRHGFSFPLPSHLRDGRQHTVVVCPAGRLNPVAQPQEVFFPEQPVVGCVERADADHVSGWAFDRRAPAEPVAVRLYDEDRLVATVPANQPRRDLRIRGIAGLHTGFSFAVPEVWKGGAPRRLSVRDAESDRELDGSPVRWPPAGE